MRDNKPGQFVDELLEASLNLYGGEEPRAGLEMRLLAGVRSRQREATRRRLVWVWAVCAAMLAAVVLLLHSARVPSRQPVTSASVPHPIARPQANPGSADSRFGSPRLVQGPKQEPRTPKPAVRATQRPEQFPTPTPLTEQEKLLMTYLADPNNAELLAKTAKTDETAETSSIEVAPLEIKPLDDSQSGQGK